MVFLQVEDSDVNGIPAVKLLSDNRLLKKCQVWMCAKLLSICKISMRVMIDFINL